jgi:hypothetical protein
MKLIERNQTSLRLIWRIFWQRVVFRINVLRDRRQNLAEFDRPRRGYRRVRVALVSELKSFLQQPCLGLPRFSIPSVLSQLADAHELAVFRLVVESVAQ